MSGIGLDMDRTMNEITRFAKVRPVLFIMMASIGAFSSIPIGTFLVFMVISLATAFISFFVVAGEPILSYILKFLFFQTYLVLVCFCFFFVNKCFLSYTKLIQRN